VRKFEERNKSEMKIEVEILKSEFASKISHHHNKLDSIECKNANLLEKCKSPHWDEENGNKNWQK